MQSSNILDLIESQVKELMTQNLRSKTAVITRIYPLILEAQNLGYTHEAIHAKTLSGGLGLELGSYHQASHRVKKGIESGRIKPSKELIRTLTQNQESSNASFTPSKIIEAMTENKVHVLAEFQETENTTTSANQIKDTLNESVKVGRKDYSKIALDKLKQKGNTK